MMGFQIKGREARRARFAVPRTATGPDGSEYPVLDADGVFFTVEWMTSPEILDIWTQTRQELTRVEFVTEEILEEITAANRGKPREVVTRRQVPTEIVDDDSLHFRVGTNVVCRTVVDWEGIEDENGKPLPCTDENKKALIAEAGGIARWIADLVVDVARFEEESETKEAEADARFRNGRDPARDEVPELADGMHSVHSGTA